MKRTVWLILPILLVFVLLGFSPDSSAAGLGEILPLGAVAGADNRAGTCYSYYTDGGSERPYMPLAYEAGSRWDRFDFAWPSIEPQEGVWSFGAHESVVEDLHAGGITNIVGILQMTPQWAASECVPEAAARCSMQEVSTSYPPGAGAFSASVAPQDTWDDEWTKVPPRGLYEPWDNWDGQGGSAINYWGRFVYEVISYYSERGVRHWEMWNEAEWGLFWCGSERDYARLLQVGYLAAKEACPDCTVLFAGLHYWVDPMFYRNVLDILKNEPNAADYNYFFDVMSVHLYSRSSNAYEVVNDIRSQMRARVSDHPIWLTETGVPVWDDTSVDPTGEPYDLAATQDEAAAYVIQSYANAWASGVEKYFFFRTHDADMTEYFGLIRNDSSVRPAYAAYDVATTYLVSPTMVTNWSYSNGARRVTLWGTPRGKVSVLWNATPDTLTFEYPATLPSARLVDRRGDDDEQTATDGVYRLSLPGATANLVSEPLIGGEPYLVIEEDTVGPSKTVVDPLPATTDSSTVKIRCNASDDAAGVWGYELEVQRDGGPWERWGGIHAAPIAFTGAEGSTTYCFRVRAWDRAGNPGRWADREPCTTIGLAGKERLYLPFVSGDKDGNG